MYSKDHPKRIKKKADKGYRAHTFPAVYIILFEQIIPSQLAEAFRDTSAEDPFLYQSNYSLAIAEMVKTIHANEDTGLVRKTFLESSALELFSLVMR